MNQPLPERHTPEPPPPPQTDAEAASACATPKPPRHEDPTRYGDWELSGKCVDF